MTFDLISVEVTCVTLPKDHCVQVPWEYINVCGYSDQFYKIPHTYYIQTVHTTYRMSDPIVFLNKMLCCPQRMTHLWRKTPFFVRLGVFWENQMENALKLCTFGCFKKKKILNKQKQKHIFGPIDPKYLEIPFDTTQQFSYVCWSTVCCIGNQDLIKKGVYMHTCIWHWLCACCLCIPTLVLFSPFSKKDVSCAYIYITTIMESVCVCPAMRFVMLWVIKLKLGSGVGDGPTRFEGIFSKWQHQRWPNLIGRTPDQSAMHCWGQRSYRGQPGSTRGQIKNVHGYQIW